MAAPILTTTQENENSPLITIAWGEDIAVQYRFRLYFNGTWSAWVNWLTATSNQSSFKFGSTWGFKFEVEVREVDETDSTKLVVTTPPDSPTGWTLTPVTDSTTQAVLAWSDPNNDDITTYDVILENVLSGDNVTTTTDVDGFNHTITVPDSGYYKIHVRGKNNFGVGKKTQIGTDKPSNIDGTRHIYGIMFTWDKPTKNTTACSWQFKTKDATSYSDIVDEQVDGDKLTYVAEGVPSTTTDKFVLRCVSDFTGAGNKSSDITINTDLESADIDFKEYLTKLDEKQKEYFEKHGRYFQKLKGTTPADNISAALDHTDPDDQEHTSDANHDFSNPLPFSIEIHESLSHNKATYAVHAELYHSSNNETSTYTAAAKKTVTMGATGNTFSDFDYSDWQKV